MKKSLALKNFLERQFGERGMVTESTVHTPSVWELVGSVTDEVKSGKIRVDEEDRGRSFFFCGGGTQLCLHYSSVSCSWSV